jgi:acyl-coenzyme A thioesterase 9
MLCRDSPADLDSLAGAVSYLHCLPTLDVSSPNSAQAIHQASAKAGIYLATASADRLDLFARMNKDNIRDLRFSGFITWTGNSSMEVIVKMEGTCPREKDADGWETLMLGRFTMVCRDSRSQKARRIPALLVETDEEQALWKFGEGARTAVSVSNGRKADMQSTERDAQRQR